MRLKSIIFLLIFVLVAQGFGFAKSQEQEQVQAEQIEQTHEQEAVAQHSETPSEQHPAQTAKAHKAFDAGTTIIEHVLDAHVWHIAVIGNHHITIPLPVILFYEGKLHCFSSSHFVHGDSYKGFRLQDEAPHKGKIVAITPNNEIAEKLPLDFSITKNVVGLFIAALSLIIIFMLVARNYRKRGMNAPKGVAALIEPIFLFIRNDVIYSNLGKKYGDKYLPYLMTLFFFILINNLLGLIPIFPFGSNTMGNVAVALTLALFTFIVTLFSTNKHYWQHIVNAPGVPWWMKFPLPIMPLIEFIEIFTKPFVLMVRLFANTVAGHIIILGFICLIFIFGEISIGIGYGVSPLTLIFGLFIDVLEILVAFVQAFIFTMLSSIYIAGAVGYTPGKQTEKH